MADEPCQILTYDYKVNLPIDENSPPQNYFQVVFDCNGVTYISDTFNSADSALVWAQTTLSDFGTWTLTDNTLIVTGTLCENGNLGYRMEEELDVFGCTIYGSSNFNYKATINDGSCVGSVTPHGGCTNNLASNYDATATWDNGSCVFGSDALVFNTAGKKAVQTKIGANIFELDVSQFASWTSRAQGIAFQTYYYTPESAAMNNSHAATLNTFLSNVGANVGVYYPIQSDAVTAAFPTFLDWLIGKFNPVFIALDQETITIKGRPAPSWTNAIYISRSQQVFGYTAIPCVWDCGLMYKTNGDTVARNNALKVLSAPPTLGRQYEQIQDRITYSATDQDYNLSLLNNYFGTLLPSYLTSFFTTFPNLTQEVIEQWQNADFDDPVKLPDALDNWTIGKMAEFTLSNTEKFKYLFWMQASNLFHGTIKREYYSLQRIAPAFGFAYSVPLTLPYSGVTGQGVYDGANSWAIIINNQSGNSYTVAPSVFSIAGKTISGSFTRNTGYSDSWNGAVINEPTVTEASLTIRPYSTSYVTFLTV